VLIPQPFNKGVLGDGEGQLAGQRTLR
jgi:hypothetical protein